MRLHWSSEEYGAPGGTVWYAAPASQCAHRAGIGPRCSGVRPQHLVSPSRPTPRARKKPPSVSSPAHGPPSRSEPRLLALLGRATLSRRRAHRGARWGGVSREGRALHKGRNRRSVAGGRHSKTSPWQSSAPRLCWTKSGRQNPSHR